MSPYYHSSDFRRDDRDENMEVIRTLVFNYWKDRWLLDHSRKIAFEVMDEYQVWSQFTIDDIDWSSLDGVDDEALRNAASLSAFYPSFIGFFSDGKATVSWELIPDGRYWMDDDGFGMTGDIKIELQALVDRSLRVIEKFRLVQ